ncbi:hypothetical protein PR202_gb19819 [Eleusine coracana subsp. coracana]|uniref:RING-type domain-containing protein n=1 Tax=Eleusine coracana subsp. coracana TaxID=191504 RepID=A0AAV5F6Y4_ELECO|nr:hypothetical protein PR202_gb19819 [Eleusine coracana subsp. coracana]
MHLVLLPNVSDTSSGSSLVVPQVTEETAPQLDVEPDFTAAAHQPAPENDVEPPAADDVPVDPAAPAQDSSPLPPPPPSAANLPRTRLQNNIVQPKQFGSDIIRLTVRECGVASGGCGEEKADCAVCLAELGAGKVAARLVPGCGHGFHVECIEAWFRVNSTCPLCRAAVAAAGRSAGSGAPRCSSV